MNMAEMFLFTIHTETILHEGSLFSDKGDVVGRIIKMKKPHQGNEYSYDVESTKEIYRKIEAGEMQIYGADPYWVTSCSTWYTRKEV